MKAELFETMGKIFDPQANRKTIHRLGKKLKKNNKPISKNKTK